MLNRLDGVMVVVLVWSPVDHGFDTWSGEKNDHKMNCCFSAKTEP